MCLRPQETARPTRGKAMPGIFGFLRRPRAKQTPRQVTGQAGEKAAARFLRKRGYRIVARNVTYPQGELDLVAVERRSGTLCFVEVRSRTLVEGEDPRVTPEESVTRAKRRRVILAARQFVAGRRTARRAMRFDVVAVRFADDRHKDPEIRHYPAAFDVAGRTT
ncbi:MAG: YraN family protein [Planctomycetes bacterium]|nr:YraN family protein [Planctomycetota bacterium]